MEIFMSKYILGILLLSIHSSAFAFKFKPELDVSCKEYRMLEEKLTSSTVSEIKKKEAHKKMMASEKQLLEIYKYLSKIKSKNGPFRIDAFLLTYCSASSYYSENTFSDLVFADLNQSLKTSLRILQTQVTGLQNDLRQCRDGIKDPTVSDDSSREDQKQNLSPIKTSKNANIEVQKN
jgi:hypothetical protein